jgi:hypothetical protein
MTRSLKLLQNLGDRPRIAWIHNRLGWLAREQGDAITARSQLEESIALSRELATKPTSHLDDYSRCSCDYAGRHRVGCAHCLEEGRTLMQEQENDWGLSWALNHLGHVAQLRGGLANARRLPRGKHAIVGIDEEPGPEHMGIAWGFQSLGRNRACRR